MASDKKIFLYFFIFLFLALGSGYANSAEKSAKRVKACSGNEPFWDLEINSRVVQLKDAGNNFVLTIPKVPPSTAEGSSEDYIALYQGKAVDHQNKFMNVIIIGDEHCSDGMSGEKYSFSAFVLSGKTLYRGCCK